MGLLDRGRPHRFDPFTGEGSKPLAGPGAYRIRDANSEVCYVGETNNLRRRIGEHLRSGKIAEVGDPCKVDWMSASAASDSFERRTHERRSISKYHPGLNRLWGGEGRPAR